jgi:hypothetical protein
LIQYRLILRALRRLPLLTILVKFGLVRLKRRIHSRLRLLIPTLTIRLILRRCRGDLGLNNRRISRRMLHHHCAGCMGRS